MLEVQRTFDGKWYVYRLDKACESCGRRDGFARRISPKEGFDTEEEANVWKDSHDPLLHKKGHTG